MVRGRVFGPPRTALLPPETPASRRRKARAAGAGFWGKSAVRGTENSATDHYRSPDPFMGRSFLESLQAFA